MGEGLCGTRDSTPTCLSQRPPHVKAARINPHNAPQGINATPVLIRLDLRRRCCMDRISDEERRRIAGLLAEGAPRWKLHLEINRSRHAIRRAVIALQRPARREPKRSPLRLSPAEREEISRGLAGGRSLRGIASGLGRAPSTVCREVAANGGAGRYSQRLPHRRGVIPPTLRSNSLPRVYLCQPPPPGLQGAPPARPVPCHTAPPPKQAAAPAQWWI